MLDKGYIVGLHKAGGALACVEETCLFVFFMFKF